MLYFDTELGAPEQHCLSPRDRVSELVHLDVQRELDRQLGWCLVPRLLSIRGSSLGQLPVVHDCVFLDAGCETQVILSILFDLLACQSIPECLPTQASTHNDKGLHVQLVFPSPFPEDQSRLWVICSRGCYRTPRLIRP